MTDKEDFASLLEGTPSGKGQGRMARRVRTGEAVEGIVVQIGHDSIFVDIGGTGEARIDRTEFADKQGNLSIKVGDTLRATVAKVDQSGPVLVRSVGRGAKGSVDISALQQAREGRIPVQGKVSRAVKGGVEVDVASVRAFCPASQLDTAYIKDLATFEGQVLDFLVVEIKDDGRSVVLSRRGLLEQEKARAAELVLQRISVGGEYEGKVSALQKYGAFIDLGGGVEGLVHISELTHGRVDRVEDVLGVGDSVIVKVLAVEPQDKSPIPKLRLSVRALSAAPEQPRVAPDEVLEGTVSKTGSFGVFVDTPKGSGLVPLRELGIPRGSDHRKAFPVGETVKVVLVHRDGGGKTTFSVSRVASVEEAANYREFTKGTKQSEQPAAAMGSLGALLAKKLSLPEPVASAAPPPAAAQPASPPGSESPTATSSSPSAVPAPVPKQDLVFKEAMEGRGIPSDAPPSSEQRPLPDGVFKRNR